jgi:hypothetical protein
MAALTNVRASLRRSDNGLLFKKESCRVSQCSFLLKYAGSGKAVARNPYMTGFLKAGCRQAADFPGWTSMFLSVRKLRLASKTWQQTRVRDQRARQHAKSCGARTARTAYRNLVQMVLHNSGPELEK